MGARGTGASRSYDVPLKHRERVVPDTKFRACSHFPPPARQSLKTSDSLGSEHSGLVSTALDMHPVAEPIAVLLDVRGSWKGLPLSGDEGFEMGKPLFPRALLLIPGPLRQCFEARDP